MPSPVAIGAEREDVRCGECGSPMVLRYTPKLGGRKFYGCSRYPSCRGTHGAHQESGEPMGTPADPDTKAARMRAHAAFDTLWRSGAMKRKAAYAWMRETLGLTPDQAHVSRMDVATCERLIAAVLARAGSAEEAPWSTRS